MGFWVPRGLQNAKLLRKSVNNDQNVVLGVILGRVVFAFFCFHISMVRVLFYPSSNFYRSSTY